MEADNEIEKTVTLISWGMKPETVRESWAWSHFEEAKKWHQFFEKLISVVKQ